MKYDNEVVSSLGTRTCFHPKKKKKKIGIMRSIEGQHGTSKSTARAHTWKREPEGLRSALLRACMRVLVCVKKKEGEESRGLYTRRLQT